MSQESVDMNAHIQSSSDSPMPQPAFEAPGPGSWISDRAHVDSPRCRYVQEMEAEYSEGFRQGFAHYGALLETIDFAYVGGFPYICPRPVGAPPDAKGPPPKLIFKLLTKLHPEIRRRIKRAAEVFEGRLWREDVSDFYERWYPAKHDVLMALQRVDLPALSDAELAQHLDRVRAEAVDSFQHHFRVNPAYMLSVGDFLAHAMRWTSATRQEVLALFEGSSPVSREGADLVKRVADALRRDPDLTQRVRADGDAAEVLEALLAAEGEIGDAARSWIDRVGHRIFTGFDIAELTGLEVPGALVASVRAALDGSLREIDSAGLRARTDAFRERVPEVHRASFDAMLEDARQCYGLRDAHSSRCECWTMGLGRVALLELGRRLAERGQIHEIEHVFELRHAQARAALTGEVDFDPDELAAYASYRASIKVHEVPATLGPPPSDPPPPEWLPPAAARMARAVDAYFGSMLDESDEQSQSTKVRGLSASGGKHVGTARLVLDPGDFDRLEAGDVLVARITTPAYNVVLPLLGGVVTDRGGVLSHPAIVAREYGIPGVVGTRDATTLIPDGARVEIDGDAGTVRVLP